MSVFTQILSESRELSELTKAVNTGHSAMAVGLSDIHKVNIIATILEREKGQPLKGLVLTEDEGTATRLCEDFNQMSNIKGEVFPLRDPIFRRMETVSTEYEQLRMNVLSRVLEGKTSVVFAQVSAAFSLLPSPQNTLNASFTLKSGDEIAIDTLIKRLLNGGYARREQIEGRGQFSVRGGIVDLFPISLSQPIRIEFWGDEVDTISFFDIESQRRTNQTSEVRIFPASEFLIDSAELKNRIADYRKNNLSLSDKAKKAFIRDEETLENGVISNYDKYLSLIYPEKNTLIDYFDNGVLFVSEQASVKAACEGSQLQWEEDLAILTEEGEMASGLEDVRIGLESFWKKITSRAIFLETFSRDISNLSPPPSRIVNIDGISLSGWNGEIKVLAEQLEDYKRAGVTVLVLCGTKKAIRPLLLDLEEEGIFAVEADFNTNLKEGGIYLLEGGLSSGMEYPSLSFAVITRSVKNLPAKKRRRKRAGEEIKNLSDIHKGDLIVHISHGIGRFDGIVSLDSQGVKKDYIKISYAGTDVLYLPVTQMDLVSRYIGGQSDKIRLNKLGGEGWKRTRSRAKKAVSEMAEELIRLYAEREKTKGFSFSEDSDWQRNFEERFLYEETEDQLTAIEEIKRDMESPRPMDRLLCGDVGYGKTEVALRAAFKCVLDGKQCAFLCPTTILAWQHYQNVLSRIGDFPVEVELLSRFRSAKEQKKIIERVKLGEVDILIGTHRIVQKDVIFKDLGLAIIDEEQRFGVSQKERFKELFHGVDVLSLSATPIPRTLSMATSGIKDMSVLEQPPQNRLPIQTYVIEYNPSVVAEAIRRELRRGGQVYYIYNRIESIEKAAIRVKELIPSARVAVAHGRMGEEKLSEIWKGVIDREIDILVSTTIIETGIDLPNCNTLIIEDADRIGLSQLYQLRGRVGRSSRRAFAYFTFRPGKLLSDIAYKRLSAIREFTRFGSGFQIAMRDLELRGAGNVLGESQHGHMEAVGYDMYIRLLSEAVGEKRGEKKELSFEDSAIDIQITANIPKEYITGISQRLEIYRKIASLRTKEDRFDLTDELIDRYGEPPKPVLALMDIAQIRATAVTKGFNEIAERGRELRFYSKELDMKKMEFFAAKFNDRIKVNAGEKPYIAVKLTKGESGYSLLKELFIDKS